MSNRDRAAVVLHDSDCPDRRCEPTAMGKYYTQADALIAAGLIHVGQGFCTKVANCRLADGHAAGCERT